MEFINGKLVTLEEKNRLLYMAYHSREEQPPHQASAALCGAGDVLCHVLQKKGNVLRIKIKQPHIHQQQQPKKLINAQEEEEEEEMKKKHVDQFLKTTCCRKPSSLDDDVHHHHHIKNIMQQHKYSADQPRSTRCGKDERFVPPEYRQQQAKEEEKDIENEEQKKKKKEVDYTSIVLALEAPNCLTKHHNNNKLHKQQQPITDYKRKFQESEKLLMERYKEEAKRRRTIKLIDHADIPTKIPCNIEIRRSRGSFFRAPKARYNFH